MIGLVGGLGEKRLTETLSRGAGDFIYPALVVVLARGISVIMHNNEIADTVVNAMDGAADSVPSVIFAPVIFLVNLPLAFLIPSTSGHATLAMPILAPLGDFAGVDRSLVITAWNAAAGWINLNDTQRATGARPTGRVDGSQGRGSLPLRRNHPRDRGDRRPRGCRSRPARPGWNGGQCSVECRVRASVAAWKTSRTVMGAVL